MPNEIEIQQHVIDLLKDEKEGLLKDKDELLKKISEANSDLRKLRHEKSILLCELSAEVKKRIEFASKLYCFEEDREDLPF